MRPRRRRRRIARLLVGVLVACWLLVATMPALAAATAAPAAHVGAPGPVVGPHLLAQDAEVVDDGGNGDETHDGDREVVVGLVAIVLLVITIGAHALYHDER